MPTTLQGLLIVFFVLPGFLAVEVDARRRPAREHSAFDKTVLSVLYSAFVHLPLSIIQAVYLPKDGILEKLGGDQVVLLNMADVEALLVAVEPLL